MVSSGRRVSQPLANQLIQRLDRIERAIASWYVPWPGPLRAEAPCFMPQDDFGALFQGAQEVQRYIDVSAFTSPYSASGPPASSEEQKPQPATLDPEEPQEAEAVAAAICIQRIFRGHRVREGLRCSGSDVGEDSSKSSGDMVGKWEYFASTVLLVECKLPLATFKRKFRPMMSMHDFRKSGFKDLKDYDLGVWFKMHEDNKSWWSTEDLHIWLKVTSRMAQQCSNMDEAHQVIEQRWEGARPNISPEIQSAVREGIDGMKQTISAVWSKRPG